MKEKRNFNYQNILIICLVSLILLIALVTFINLNDKTKVYKSVVNSTFDIVDKALGQYKTAASPFDKANTLTATITSPDDVTNLKLNYNPSDKIINLNANVTKDNNMLLDGTLIHQDDKTYLKSNVLNNTYELNTLGSCEKEDCSDMPTVNDLISSFFSTNTFSYKNLNTISKNLRKVVLSSLDKKYITKNKVTTLVNNQDTKTTRYSYILNSLSLSKLVNKINKDNNLKEALFATFGGYFQDYGITKDNFKEKLLEQEGNRGTLNIYTTGSSKIVKVTLNIIDGSTFDVTVNDGAVVIDYDDNDMVSGKVIYNTNTQKINLVYYYDDTQSIELEVNNNDSNSYTINYNAINSNEKYTGVINLDITSATDDDVKGTIKIKSSDIDLTIDYEASINNLDMREDVTDYIDIKNISEEEINNFVSTLEKLENNQIFKMITELFNEE